MEVTEMIRAPQAVKIKEIIDETPTIKTFKFDTDIKANPGEFLMVWNVSDEKPMSISNIGDNELSITVKNIGDFTSKLHELEVGDMIGVRGSYGNGFKTDFKDKKLLAFFKHKLYKTFVWSYTKSGGETYERSYLCSLFKR